VSAVLNDLTKVLKRHWGNGEIVRFGDFGTSEGAETVEKFNASLIKGGKVIFRPGIDLKKGLQRLNMRWQSKIAASFSKTLTEQIPKASGSLSKGRVKKIHGQGYNNSCNRRKGITFIV
jgi:hypothetical protein